MRMHPIRLFVWLAIAAIVAGALPVSPSPAAAQGPCGTSLPSRLSVGVSARVVPGDGTGNNLRAAPSSGADTTVLGVLPNGEIVFVIGGPTCANDLNWFQVRRWDGQTGWTAEADSQDYWLEPWPQTGATIPPGPAPDLPGVRFAYLNGIAGSVTGGVRAFDGSVNYGLGNIMVPDRHLAWSPDGNYVGFSDGDEVYIAGQFDIQNISNAAGIADWGPTWSPDGMRIAFASERDGNAEIYSVNLNGLVLTRLTNSPGTDDSPAWSPDGMRVAFVSDRDGNQDIYVMSAADGSALQQVTQTTAGSAVGPRWSPDGSMLAYIHSPAPGAADLWIVRPGQQPQQLTQNAVAHSVSWSTDGARLAFAANTGPGTPEYLYSIRSDGTDLMQYTVNGTEIRGTSWTPENNWILFADNRSGNFEVYAIRTAGFGLVNLTNNPGQDFDPVVQPPSAPLALAVPGLVPGPTPAPTVAAPPGPNPADQDLLLIYDAAVPVFTLQNISGRAINLVPLSFEGSGLTVPASIWGEFSASPMDAFMNRGCLMLWPFGIPDQPSPPECGQARQGWVTDARYTFWRGTFFTVLYNGVPVVTCDVAPGTCTVDLP
jgi:Tol biopolymer transport system component